MNIKLSKLQWTSIFYGVAFVFVVTLGYLPGVTDENGLMFGLFHIHLIDDILHLASGVWAFTAAYISRKQCLIYFKYFGSVYFLDGVAGILIGTGFLDFSIIDPSNYVTDMATRISLNIPHIVLGGSMTLIGFILSKKKFLQN
jgi:hypothetical protein